jgi:hypothetical protein
MVDVLMLDIEDLIIPGCALAIFVIGAAAIWAAFAEQQQWDAFAAAHQCKKVGEISSSTSIGVGIGTDGKTSFVPITTPGKTGFACNDGVTYWR